MIGYPFGLKDEFNNLPIVRKGITATPYYLNYESNPKFLVDIPIYFGSSGSPIIIYNSTSYNDRIGNTFFGRRFLFLGINYATYTRNFEGKLIPKFSTDITDSLKVSTQIPYNIAIVIKAEKLLDFKPLILSRMNFRHYKFEFKPQNSP